MNAEFLYRHHLTAGRTAAVVLILVACMAFPAGTAQPVHASANQTGPILTVNDPSDPGGAACQITACSLRAAISAANAGGLPGGYTIAFDLTYPAQITLADSLPDITGKIVMIGPGKAALAISGNGLVRIFTIPSGGSLSLSGLTLTHGWNGIEGGGAIRNGGSLEINNVTITENLAGGGNGGGILNDAGGVVAITNTAFLDNNSFHDGAIANSGSVTISNSVFSGNRGRTGGAIENFAGSTMTITGSAFTDNVAKISNGGAIANAGTLVIANSTFYQNGSPIGADISSGDTLHVTNSTFFGAITPSYHSIAASANAVFHNNLFAAEPGVDNCAAQPAAVFSADNLSTDATCPGATQVALADLMLAPLDNVGGVPFLTPLPGSPAIDAGDDAVCAAAVGAPAYGAGAQDQRGIPRPAGAHCDIGAIEALIRIVLPTVMR